MARPDKYLTHVKPHLVQVEAWARDGLIDKQIAKNLGIAYSSFREYVKRHSALSAALKKGKEVVDIEVENALLKRAKGYKYDEVTRESMQEIDPETGQFVTKMVETKRVTKEVQPDVTAQIFWLKNRKPEVWRDKQTVEHEGKLQHNVEVEGLSDDELRERIEGTVQAIADLQSRIGTPPKA